MEFFKLIYYLSLPDGHHGRQTADRQLLEHRIIEEHRRLFNDKVEALVRDKQTTLLSKEEYDHIVYVLDQL